MKYLLSLVLLFSLVTMPAFAYKSYIKNSDRLATGYTKTYSNCKTFQCNRNGQIEYAYKCNSQLKKS